MSPENISQLEACLGFALSYPEINKIVFGVDSFHQFEQIINSFNLKFPSKFPKWQYPIDDYLINLNKW